MLNLMWLCDDVTHKNNQLGERPSRFSPLLRFFTSLLLPAFSTFNSPFSTDKVITGNSKVVTGNFKVITRN
ncbi:MAG: hypothetical protein LBH72_00770, partial [Proteiniphilum sp.]|nr:hypothetical protein [Proteiniphilum sp.]